MEPDTTQLPAEVGSGEGDRDAWLSRTECSQALIDALPERMAVIDRSGAILATNQSWARHELAASAIGQGSATGDDLLSAIRDSANDPTTRALVAGIEQVLAGKLNIYQLEYEALELLNETGRPKTFIMRVVPLGSEAGGAVVTHVDVSAQRQLERRLSHGATHDSLTGLPNRLLLTDRLVRSLDQGARAGNTVAVLFCDLDRLKDLNDTLGHAAGDQVLISVASRLSAISRPTDTVARFGGDEFVVVLDNVLDEYAAREVSERISKTLAEPFVIDGRELHFRTSIGVALSTVSPGAGRATATDLLRDADNAMARAKELDAEQIVVFRPDMHDSVTVRLALDNDLRLAAARDELRAVFQPIFCIRDDRMIGVEALVRWQHPERGLLGPGAFLQVAEESGVIRDIGDWMLNEAASHAARWASLAPPDFGFTVNLSPRQLSDQLLPARIHEILQIHAVDPRMLCLAITESGIMANPESSVRILNQLHDMGIRIAVDDFGTGYSSLAYLHGLPVDILKIDRSFISRIGEDPLDRLPTGGRLGQREQVVNGQRDGRAEALVHGIAHLGLALGMTLIAEGIETQRQLELVRRAGVHGYQGFLRAKPLHPDQITQMLTQAPR